MSKFSRFIKQFACTGMCALMLFGAAVTTYAAEKTGVWFSIYLDDEIQFTENDTYVMKLMNKETKESETVTIAADEAAYNFYEVELPEGAYSVVDFTYEGPNQKLSNLPVAVSNNFEATDAFDTVDIGIGKESALFIDSQYVNAYVYSSDEETYEEFRSPEYVDDPEEDAFVNEEGSVLEDDSVVSEEPKEAEGEKEETTKNNYLIGLLPVAVIACIVGIVLYVLRKKKKI